MNEVPPRTLALHRVLVVRNRLGRELAQFAAVSGPDGAGIYEFHARDGGMLISGFTPIPKSWFGRIGLYRGLAYRLALRFCAVKAPKAQIVDAKECRPLELLCAGLTVDASSLAGAAD